MTLEPGMKFGSYEILAPLGAGGMGEVWRARDVRVDRAVALKVLPEEFFESEERRKRFEREARLLASLNHPGIATLYSFEEIPSSSSSSPARHILVMELLDGETLRDRLRAGPLAPRKAVDVAVQMAKALAAAHEKGIVHRDLKPENVFLTKDDRVKVFDFGLAKLSRREESAEAETESALTEAGAVFGTVGYMSPEQVRGEPVDHRSDIFSLGTIVYEMVSGRNPFRRGTQPETMTAILKDEPTPLTETPVGLPRGPSVIVARCLEKDPTVRLQSAADLAFALEAVQEQPASSPAGMTAGSKPSPRLAARRLATLAAVLLGLAGAYVLGGRRRPDSSPSFRRLTFRHGHVNEARFAPGGQSILYGATWEGSPAQVFTTRAGIPEASPLALPSALLLGISSNGEMALSLKPEFVGYTWRGTLGRAPMTGGAPREVIEGVQEADWAPSGTELAVVRRPPSRDFGSVLELPAGKPLLESAGRIAQPRISPKGDLVAFLDHPDWDDAGSVAVVDRAGRKRALSTGWLNARGLAWSPSGDEIWFTASKSGRDQALHAVTLSGMERLVASLGGYWILHDIARDGRALLSLNSTRLGFTGSFPAGERDLSWFDWSMMVDLSQDGEKILLAEFGEGAGAKYFAYLRRTDGSPAVRLGEGRPIALSPDGRWALVLRGNPPTVLVALPTGSGEERALPPGDVRAPFSGAGFFPDGKRILCSGTGKAGRQGLFVQDLEGGLPQPFGPDGLAWPFISPDGRWVAAWSEKEKKLVLLTGEGERRRSLDPGPEPDDVRWSADGRSLLLARFEGPRVRVDRLDATSGARTLVREIPRPGGKAGLLGQANTVRLSGDARWYAFGYFSWLTDLYLVEGLR